MAVGQRQPIYAGTVGRAVAAKTRASAAELESVLAQIRWQQPMKLDQYLSEAEASPRAWLGY